jgi:hypothetical protein
MRITGRFQGSGRCSFAHDLQEAKRMRTEQDQRRTLNEGAERMLHAFETRDFYLAGFLRRAGYELLDLRTEGIRKVFVFQDRPSRRCDVMGYYSEADRVRAPAYAAAIKDMKALLHNA